MFFAEPLTTFMGNPLTHGVDPNKIPGERGATPVPVELPASDEEVSDNVDHGG